ncbi:MAG: DUF4932 domain-containing protein [Mucinivorans sp.]
MKKIFLLSLIAILSLAALAKPNKENIGKTITIDAVPDKTTQNTTFFPQPTVDKRVELMSIVFRLAGNREYNDTYFKLYTDRIESHFGAFKDHPLIKYARSLVADNGVSYDAVMSLAVRLDSTMQLRESVVDSTLDSRWDRTKVWEFAKLLKQFCADTRFDDFYRQNQTLYKEAADRFMPIYNHVDLSWYRDFYGRESKDVFRIILAMGNGGGNYGINLTDENRVRNVYSIMGTWDIDSLGMAAYRAGDIFPTLIHEFNHSFAPTFDERFARSGKRIFSVVGPLMAKQAYSNWSTVLTEALVRAAVIKYMKDHDVKSNTIRSETQIQKSRGFVWIDTLVAELESYSRQRQLYPTLESYMPKLVDAYLDMAEYTVAYDSLRPKVVSIDQFTNGDTEVDSALQTITVNLDRPLIGRGHSFGYGKLGQRAMPAITGVKYTNDNRTVVISVDLEPDHQYQTVMLGLSFRTFDGIEMHPYEISFKTAK